MKLETNHMLLYAVTDRAWTQNNTLESQVLEAVKGGVTCVQLREKDLSDENFLKLAFKIKPICKEYNVPFIINDNVQVAISCKADGIHIGQDDMDTEKTRKLIGKDMILGVSAGTVEEAVTACKKGADYIGVGAVFSTSTKLDADSISLDTLKNICDSVSVPVVAIGGIYKHNMHKLKNTGISGVALVSAIFASDDIRGECTELLELSKETVS